MIQMQQSMVFSPYMEIYDLVVPKDNILRKMSFNKYCHDNGRYAIDPIRMFKYLLLKSIHDLSDADLVERSKYNMSFKDFLGMAPEDKVMIPAH